MSDSRSHPAAADRCNSALATQGVKRVHIAWLGFVSECLETLEEIGMQARQVFLAAGGGAAVLFRFGVSVLFGVAPEAESVLRKRLFALSEAEFEIPERRDALERKLDLAAGTVRTLVDLIDRRHALRVKRCTAALVVIEILLTPYQMGRG